MLATPITPGQAYRVTYQGRTLDVLAAHGCDAICTVLDFLGL
jgi:hypothetical protein